jgi:hypothetical protein
MLKMIQVNALVDGECELQTAIESAAVPRAAAASLRKLCGDWMLGKWIGTITHAALAFHLWHQKSLTKRFAGKTNFSD